MLRSSSAATPELDAQLLLAHLLGRDRAAMLMDPPDYLPPEAPDAYRRLLARRAAGEPVFYITGKKEFHNYVFYVDPSVLIPRPETEEMVEAALKRFPGPEPKAVCDVGTGSGCIGITLALERPQWRVTAVDVSEKALEVAKINAQHLNAANITFAKSDLFSAVPEKFDLIVSNPPYVDVAVRGGLQVEVRKFEPPIALFAEESGLKVIRQLVAEAAEHLNPGGAFFCEIGYDQKEAVEKLFYPAVWKEVVFIKDLAGHDRIVSAAVSA
ncbi:MAG: peptide chain release factor N(5)-glutamine methyltransferase [Nitrospinae bacterium]|nr:peptide chain release factor N(5)-glutamine methyltransferase [Nitrospinota bacterium]